MTAAGAADPWLANTGFRAGDTIAGVVGREHDALTGYTGCLHPGETVLFHYESSADAPADATRYTAPSGARVFATGAQEFSWALDGWRSNDTLAPSVPVGADRTAPADPRVQAFMHNALDDLTRPQPPLRVWRQRTAQGLRVRTGWPDDPRIVSRVVFRVRDDGSSTQVCAGHLMCLPPRATQPGTYRFMAEYVDAWGATSAPAYSTPWTFHGP